MKVEIVKPYDFTHHLNQINKALIEQIVRKEKCFEYIARFITESASYLSTLSDGASEKKGLRQLAKNLAEAYPDEPAAKELSTLAQKLADSQISLEELEKETLKFLLSAIQDKFQQMDRDEQISWMNRNRIPLKSLNIPVKNNTVLIRKIGEGLKHLDLTGLSVEERELSVYLRTCKELSDLILEGSVVTPELMQEMAKLEKLEKLTVRKASLAELPDEIRLLENLHFLDLSQNWLKELPEAACSLSSLRTLILAENLLETLPYGIGKLSELRELNLRNNSLRELPSQIGELGNLESLDISKNEIVRLAMEIGQLKSLVRLNGSGNWLVDIPLNIRNLPLLKDLQLQKNEFKKLPLALTEISSLERLNLGQNLLDAIPEQVSAMSGLKELNLMQNQFETIPEEAALLPSLERLNMSGNLLGKIPVDLLQKMKALKWVSFGGNRILHDEIVEARKKLPHLTIV